MRFLSSENGFVLVFAILMLPVFLGFGLLIIDIGRGNNAQADLQSAADAVALAGAAELDGGIDAITRAKAAMGNLENPVSMLLRSGDGTVLQFADEAGNEFGVVFLTNIPENDTTPITTGWLTDHQTVDGTEAEFIYVHAQSDDLETAFFNPATYLQSNVPIAVVAVAKSISAACDIPPIYICNPFEFDDAGGYAPDQLQTEFDAGNLHGRLIRLHPPGSSTQSPGNFGFLSVDGSSSASDINDFFAGARNPTCYSTDSVESKPGAAVAIAQGINTRFDMYEGQYANNSGYVPAPSENVRMGKRVGYTGNQNNLQIEECVGVGNGATFGDDHIMDMSTGLFNNNGTNDHVFGFPDNTSMVPANQSNLGASIGTSGDWDIDTYFARNYPTPSSPPLPSEPAPSNVESAFSNQTPSRYDVYRAEIENGWTSIRGPNIPAQGSGSTATPELPGESGAPLCGDSMSPKRLPTSSIEDPKLDRRLIVGAVVDCNSQSAPISGKTTLQVNSYAAMFMSRPMVQYYSGYDQTIDIEIVDISGFGGNGLLDEFIRAEAVLVR